MQNETFPPHDTPETAPAKTETAKQKFEQERLTRRQALKKFGMTSAMATFALFSVDDLARMVGGAMERQARNNKIATQVAEEFKHSGIALAATYYTYYTCAIGGCKNLSECTPNNFIWCKPCSSTTAIHPCVKEALNCNRPYGNGGVPCQDCCYNMRNQCVAANYGGCDALYSSCMTDCPATG